MSANDGLRHFGAQESHKLTGQLLIARNRRNSSAKYGHVLNFRRHRTNEINSRHGNNFSNLLNAELRLTIRDRLADHDGPAAHATDKVHLRFQLRRQAELIKKPGHIDPTCCTKHGIGTGNRI